MAFLPLLCLVANFVDILYTEQYSCVIADTCGSLPFAGYCKFVGILMLSSNRVVFYSVLK